MYETQYFITIKCMNVYIRNIKQGLDKKGDSEIANTGCYVFHCLHGNCDSTI